MKKIIILIALIGITIGGFSFTHSGIDFYINKIEPLMQSDEVKKEKLDSYKKGFEELMKKYQLIYNSIPEFKKNSNIATARYLLEDYKFTNKARKSSFERDREIILKAGTMIIQTISSMPFLNDKVMIYYPYKEYYSGEWYAIEISNKYISLPLPKTEFVFSKNSLDKFVEKYNKIKEFYDKKERDYMYSEIIDFIENEKYSKYREDDLSFLDKYLMNIISAIAILVGVGAFFSKGSTSGSSTRGSSYSGRSSRRTSNDSYSNSSSARKNSNIREKSKEEPVEKKKSYIIAEENASSVDWNYHDSLESAISKASSKYPGKNVKIYEKGFIDDYLGTWNNAIKVR